MPSASTVTARRRKQAIKDGTHVGRQPVEQIAEHLDKLVQSGLSMPVIAERAGVCVNTVIRIRHRAYPMVNGGTATALLGLSANPEGLRHRGTRSAVGPRRMVRALAACGYSIRRLSFEMGYEREHQMARLVQDRYRFVSIRVDTSVRALYAQLSRVAPAPTGHAVAAQNMARRNGWHGPDAWSETSINDPAATPYSWTRTCSVDADDAAVAAVIIGRRRWSTLTRDADRLETVRRLASHGLGPVAIARRLGVTPDVTARAFNLLGLKAAA